MKSNLGSIFTSALILPVILLSFCGLGTASTHAELRKDLLQTENEIPGGGRWTIRTAPDSSLLSAKGLLREIKRVLDIDPSLEGKLTVKFQHEFSTLINNAESSRAASDVIYKDEGKYENEEDRQKGGITLAIWEFKTEVKAQQFMSAFNRLSTEAMTYSQQRRDEDKKGYDAGQKATAPRKCPGKSVSSCKSVTLNTSHLFIKYTQSSAGLGDEGVIYKQCYFSENYLTVYKDWKCVSHTVTGGEEIGARNFLGFIRKGSRVLVFWSNCPPTHYPKSKTVIDQKVDGKCFSYEDKIVPSVPGVQGKLPSIIRAAYNKMAHGSTPKDECPKQPLHSGDHDGDGVPDWRDLCPLQRQGEVRKGFDTSSLIGCPDNPTKWARLKVEGEKAARKQLKDFTGNSCAAVPNASAIVDKLKFKYTSKIEYKPKSFWDPKSGMLDMGHPSAWAEFFLAERKLWCTGKMKKATLTHDNFYHEVGHYLTDALGYEYGGAGGEHDAWAPCTTYAQCFDEATADLSMLLMSRHLKRPSNEEGVFSAKTVQAKLKGIPAGTGAIFSELQTAFFLDILPKDPCKAMKVFNLARAEMKSVWGMGPQGIDAWLIGYMMYIDGTMKGPQKARHETYLKQRLNHYRIPINSEISFVDNLSNPVGVMKFQYLRGKGWLKKKLTLKGSVPNKVRTSGSGMDVDIIIDSAPYSGRVFSIRHKQTDYETELHKDGSITVTVHEGSVELSPPDLAPLTIYAGQSYTWNPNTGLGTIGHSVVGSGGGLGEGFTLDFETGRTNGWVKTGTAFNHQPTYGDNPTARRRGQPSKHVGNYWIGTFEKYQGSGSQTPGSVQGDGPIGTLTSNVFTIPTGSLSFLVGGGSSFQTRVELLVSGNKVLSVSGRNTETMHRVKWDLNPWAGQQGQIRLVDNASGGWGHINADDFRFSHSSSSGGTPGGGANLVTNGSFEQGRSAGSSYVIINPGSTDLPGWQITGKNIDVVGSAWNSSHGPRAVDIHGTGPGGIRQSFPTTPGMVYSVSFDLAGNPWAGPQVKTVHVDIPGIVQKTYQFDTKGKSPRNMGWTRRSFTFRATQTRSTLHIYSNYPPGNGAGPAVDNVVVVAASGGGGGGGGPAQGTARLLTGNSNQDMVGPNETFRGNGKYDAIFQAQFSTPNRTVTAVEVSNTNGIRSVWDTRPNNRLWLGGVVIGGRPMNRSDGSVNFSLGSGQNTLDFFVEDNGSIRGGKTNYRMTIFFASGDPLIMDIVPANSSNTPAGTNQEPKLQPKPKPKLKPKPKPKPVRQDSFQSIGREAAPAPGQQGDDSERQRKPPKSHSTKYGF